MAYPLRSLVPAWVTTNLTWSGPLSLPGAVVSQRLPYSTLQRVPYAIPSTDSSFHVRRLLRVNTILRRKFKTVSSMASNETMARLEERLATMSEEQRNYFLGLLQMLQVGDLDEVVVDRSSQWLKEDIGAPPLWLDDIRYQANKLCTGCTTNLVLLANQYLKRDQADFIHKNLREVVSLFSTDEIRSPDGFTPKEIMKHAIRGCHMCSLAIAASWFRGDVPHDTGRWMNNPNWRNHAQMLLVNMYSHKDSVTSSESLCQIIYGTRLTTDLYPEGDHSGFWGAAHLETRENMDRILRRKEKGVATNSQLGPPPNPPLCSSTGDAEALEIAAWWLKRCLTEHSTCAAADEDVNAADRPARLLYVGEAGDKNTQKIRIHINDPKNTPDYLALSYCWGKKEFPRLLETHLKGHATAEFELKTLPATIQDAIAVTRFLGFSYIWIDCLCIIQDSKEDWATESLKMGSIYRKSKLTIAALAAPDSFYGLFVKRNPLCYQDLNFRVHGEDFVVSLRSRDVQPGYLREFGALGAAASPLQTRAWCVQELVASPRTLFFGSAGISWQCIECEADEGYPMGSTEKNVSATRPNVKTVVNEALMSQSNYRNVWNRILERYSGCELTYPSDKLHAISGIAKLLAKTSGQKWIAGLWEDNLLLDLLWQSENSQWPNNRELGRLENDCPSFSWASVAQGTSNFKYAGKDTELDAKSIDILSDNSSEDGSSQNRHVLRLVSQMKAVTLLPATYSKTARPALMLSADAPAEADDGWIHQENEIAEIVRLQASLNLDWTIDRKVDEDETMAHPGPYQYSWSPDIPLDGSIKRAWVVSLAQQKGFSPLGSLGLVVVPAEARGENARWKRIGLLFHSGFYETDTSGKLRTTVQWSVNDNIEWEETAKHRAPNPFLLDQEKECIQVDII